MKKLYVYLSMITGMLFMLALGAKAQRPIFKADAAATFYAGVATASDNYFGTSENGGIVSFDPAAPYASPAVRICKAGDMMLAGAMVKDATSGNTYYAMFANAKGEPTNFCTVDFKTGKTTILGKASKLVTMYYDGTAKTMYGIGLTETGSTYYSIDLKNGNLTKITDYTVKIVAACTWNYSKTIAIGTDGHFYYIDAKGAEDRGILRDAAASNTPVVSEVSQSLAFDGTTLYWLANAKSGSQTAAKSFLAKVNVTQKEFSRIGKTNDEFGAGNLSLTGLALEMTSASTGGDTPTGPDNVFYASIKDDQSGLQGGFVKSDLADPYKNMKVIKEYPADMGTFDITITGAGAVANDIYYAIIGKMGMGNYTPKEFCTVNVETGEYTKIADATIQIDGMAYSSKEKTMYGIKTDDNSTLYTINLTTGAMTEVAAFDTQILGLFIAKDGTIYGMDTQNIYSLNIKDKTKTVAMELKTIKPDAWSSQSFAYLGNTLYWLARAYEEKATTPTTFLATIDLSAKKVTRMGTGKFSPIVYVGLAIVPTPKKSETKMAYIKTYGDPMDAETPMEKRKCALVESFYYDENNLLVRSSTRGYAASGQRLDPMKYHVYKYNDKNQLVESSYRQYQQNDGIYKLYSAPKGFTYYEYDNNGKLKRLENNLDAVYYLYEWDGDNKTKETMIRISDDAVRYAKTFSDFVEGAVNCPKKEESTGMFSNNNYEGVYEYDADFNKISYTTYDLEGTLVSKYKWIYVDGKLSQQIKYAVKKGQFDENSKDNIIVNYTVIDKNNTRIVNDGPMHTIETTAEYIGDTAPSSLKVENKSTVASPNTFLLTWEAPGNLDFTPSYEIYRNGVLINTIETTSYTDKGVENDTISQDYFVQTIDKTTGIGYNISNTATVEKLKTELAAPTGIEYVSHKKAMQGTIESFMVTVGWKAPQSEYQPTSYNIYVGAMSKMPKNVTTDGTTAIPIEGTQTEVDFGPTEYESSKEQYITIEAVYPIGRIKSEPVLVKIIESNITENALSSMVEFTGDAMFIHGEYTSLDMYNTNGSLVKTATGETKVDISSLPTGIYMVRINHDGKVETLKTVKK